MTRVLHCRRSAIVLSSTLLLAWVEPAPARQTATASISGTVVNEDADSRPIARAVVTLNGAALRPNLVVVADDSGRFTFTSVPAGSVTVTASKSPYLTMSYGQTAIGRGSGLPVAVQPGQQVSDIVIKLPRGSVIAGRLTEERGRAVRNAPIFLLQYRNVNGERALWSLGSQWPPTDANGMYRAYGLAPGDYIVAAYVPGLYSFFPGGNAGPYTPSGGSNTEAYQASAAELTWAAQQIRGAAAAAPEPPAGRSVAYVAAYYPGTPDPAAAVAVAVGRGEEHGGVDFTMTRQTTARIEGRVLDASGRLAPNVRIESSGMNGGTMGFGSTDGKFSMPALLPGAYRIIARSADASTWAMTEVTLSGRDVTDVVLTLGPSPTLTGRVTFEASALTPPTDMSTVRVSLVAVPAAGLLQSRIAPDGTFQIPGVGPGRYRVQASVPTPGGAPGAAGPRWVVKSAMLKGRDAADAPVEIGMNESVSNVVVTFTDQATELSGTLRDAAGQPASGVYILVFSKDSALWLQGSRRLPAPVRSATNGSFRFAGLPAGPYWMAAVTDFSQADLFDAAFLRLLTQSGAVSVTLADGEKKVQDLTLAGR